MYVDINSAQPLDKHDFPSLPLPGANVRRRWKAGEVEFVLQKDAPSWSGDDITCLLYALSAWLDGAPIAVCTIEALDLRSLSYSLGVSEKELKREHGVHGHLASPQVAGYSKEGREELGAPGFDVADEEVVTSFLQEYLLDSLDIVDELVVL